jgi:hypothetical protein
VRGQDAYRHSTEAERKALASKAARAAEAREARKRQRTIDQLLKDAER